MGFEQINLHTSQETKSVPTEKMKQLDVVVSPPAFVWDPNFTLTHMSFVMNFFLMNYYLVTFGIV